MIIPHRVNPKFSLYYMGAQILEIVKSASESPGDTYSIYEVMKKNNSNYSLSQHLLAIDWLFLLGKVEQSPSGEILICL